MELRGERNSGVVTNSEVEKGNVGEEDGEEENELEWDSMAEMSEWELKIVVKKMKSWRSFAIIDSFVESTSEVFVRVKVWETVIDGVFIECYGQSYCCKLPAC